MDGAPLIILYEDADLLVVAKQSGVHSVSLAESDDSIAARIAMFDPSMASIGGRPGESGLVHRLDFETSGVLIAARNDRVWERLRASVQEGALYKEYLALVKGELSSSEVTVESYLGGRYRRGQKVSSSPVPMHRMLPARTTFARYATPPPLLIPLRAKSFTLVTAIAPTARRHQIRAHASLAGFPLVGDSLYGSKEILPQAFPKFILHASLLRMNHPRTGREVVFEAPLVLPEVTFGTKDS